MSSVRSTRNQQEVDEYDPEQFIGSSQVLFTNRSICKVVYDYSLSTIWQIPILVLGTKLDLAEEVRTHFNRRPSPIAEECGADEIFVVNHSKS